jgi:glutathione S-transferase
MAGGGEPGSSACFAASCEGTQNVAVVPDEKIVAEHTQKLAKILDVYEVQLSKHKYLAGEFVSIADLSHLPMTYYYFCLAKQPHLLTSRKHVAAWFDAISTRPSWCTVLEHAAPFFTKWAAT